MSHPINTINAEDNVEVAWERKQKNASLSSALPESKKQEKWDEVFGRLPESDLVF